MAESDIITPLIFLVTHGIYFIYNNNGEVMLTVASNHLRKHKRKYCAVIFILTSIIFVLTKKITIKYAKEKASNSVENRINEMEIKDGVAQLLMVGLTSDYLNYKQDKEMDKILSTAGVGFVIMNTYNYYAGNISEENHVDGIADFNKDIQKKSLNNNAKIPILIATDFESPSFSSIKKGLKLPPSALCLGASQNTEYISMLGKFVGNELSNVGIHIILGPVIDTYNVSQGNKSTLQDRCFAGSLNGVVSLSSHYINGLNKSKILSFTKHMPSYGSVENNPHDYVIPNLEESKDDLILAIDNISRLNNMAAGIMTSHVNISFLRNEKFVTTSKEFIDEYLNKSDLKKSIIISDDLTSMGAILKYMKVNRLGYKELAIQTFDAGHDVLLFSHFSNMNNKSKFTINDLHNVIFALSEHIKTNPTAKKHYKNALNKVLSLKVKAAQLHGGSSERVLNPDKTKTLTDYSHGIENIQKESELFLSVNDNNFPKTANELILSIIRSGTTIMNEKNNYSIDSSSYNTKIAFCIVEDQLYKFRNAYSSKFTSSEFIPIPKIKDGKQFKAIKKHIMDVYNKYDIIIYTSVDKSDSDLLTQLKNKHKDYQEKVIVFCHGNPIIFSDNLLRNTTIISLFTNHPESFQITIEILDGSYKPRNIDRLPINLGEGGRYHSVSAMLWPEPAPNLPPTSPTLEQNWRTKDYIEFLSPNYIVIKRNVLWLEIILSLLLSYTIHRLMRYYYNIQKVKESPNDLLFISSAYNVLPILFFFLTVYIKIQGGLIYISNVCDKLLVYIDKFSQTLIG